MSRRRLYVPLQVDYYNDEKVIFATEASPWCHVLYTSLLARAKHAENDGKVNAADVIAVHVPRWKTHIETLVSVGLLETCDGGWQFPAWTSHNLTMEQVAERRKADAERQERFREARARRLADAAVTRDKTREQRVVQRDENALWLSSKQEAVREPTVLSTEQVKKSTRARDPILDSLALIDAPTGDLTEVTSWGRYAKLRKQLPAATTPEDIAARADRYRRMHPTWDCTAGAVVKHWHALAPAGLHAVKTRPRGEWIDGGDPTREPTRDDITQGRYERYASF